MEEPEEKALPVNSVCIGVEKQDDGGEGAVGQDELIADAVSQGLDQATKLGVREDFGLAGVPSVHRFSLESENRLEGGIDHPLYAVGSGEAFDDE